MIQLVLGTVCMVLGAGFVLVAGIGVVRLPDVPMRMHASTKAGTLGVALIAAALIIFNIDDLSVVTRALALIVFVMLTAPVAAHMIARAAYNAGITLWDETMVDEQRAYYQEKGLPADVGLSSTAEVEPGEEPDEGR